MTIPSLTTTAGRIRSGQLCSVEATEYYLDRIARFDSELHAYITVDWEGARRQAQEADRLVRRGEPVGPLHGVPIALKDNIDTAGLTTTAGSTAFAHRVPERDATVVRRLRRAGAVVLGKVGLHEFAYGATGENRHFGSGRNAWSGGHISGGSSGGSAVAVSGGLCAGALGTDTGGSVRIPAALNGVTGIRPTAGRVSGRGVFPTTWTFDTVGSLGRSVGDAALVLAVLLKQSSTACEAIRPARGVAVVPGLQSLAGIRVATPANFFFEGVHPMVGQRVRQAIDTLAWCGAVVEECAFPLAAGAVEAVARMISAEAYAIHREQLGTHGDLYGEDVRERLSGGQYVSGADYAYDREYARKWRRSLAKVFERFDVIAVPTTEVTAPVAGGGTMVDVTRRLVRLTSPWSLAGLPALSLPCGLDTQGLPIGFQLVAAPFREATVVRVGAEFQAATDWHLAEPPVGRDLDVAERTGTDSREVAGGARGMRTGR